MSSQQPISAYFPFESKYVDVHGSRLHYLDKGTGDPILFMHGNPTSSYLWRNIIPHLTDHGRCIAFDLVGMGKSDKPKLAYRFFDHARYVDGFIEALDLHNLTLVLHDWGSGLGFHYARRHPANIKALAFMEAIVRPITWDDMPAQFRLAFRLMRTDGIGWLMISALNMFVNVMLPRAVERNLSGAEMAAYRAPFPTIASRKPVRQWPREVPISGHPADVVAAVSAYYAWLQETDLPKILFYATPGALIPPDVVPGLQQALPNLATVDLGAGVHFVQEDHPHRIGSELAAWYAAL